MRGSVLIDPEFLHDILKCPILSEKVILLDCRASLTDEQFGYDLWRSGSIVGSGFFDLHVDMSSRCVSDGRFPLPSEREFSATIRRLGIQPDNIIVVYDESCGEKAAARAWWMLSLWAQHPNVYLLNGGIKSWVAMGGEVSPGLDFKSASCWTPVYNDNVLIDADEILLDKSLGLLDSREESRFYGIKEPLDQVAGHIPGAICRPISLNTCEAGKFKSGVLLRNELLRLSVEVVYCGAGVAACHNALVYRIACLPVPRVYVGSWSHWIKDSTRPRSLF